MTVTEFVVYAVDVGCDCCSYIAAATFDSKVDAMRWVAESRDPSNYHIEGF